jgi:ParB-like chromosome segregation protein Spo0J
MSLIPLTDIGYDPEYYPRVNGKEDWLTVLKYAEALIAQPRHEFPPVVLVAVSDRGYRYLLLDGLHRIRAYAKAGRAEIPATIERLPESKWMERSAELNSDSKRGLDDGDRAYVATRLQKQGYSLEKIGKILQIRAERVEKIIAERVRKITVKVAKRIPPGRGNREIDGDHYGFLKAPFIEGAETAAAAEQVLLLQGPVAAREVSQILDSAIVVLECGVDWTDEDIVARVERLHLLTAARG